MSVYNSWQNAYQPLFGEGGFLVDDSCRISITGGAGFIGSHLVETSLKSSFEVTVLDDLSTGSLENIKPYLNNTNFRFVRGDVRDKRAIKERARKITV